jgi:hypothetical protein
VVNVIENRARVELRPLTPPARGPAENWRVCKVMVDESSDVEGYPNLLAADLPRELEALIPAAVLGELETADRWRVEASLVAPGRLRVEKVAT